MHTKTIAWADCHEFDEAIAQINQDNLDMHEREKEKWRRIFQMGSIKLKE